MSKLESKLTRQTELWRYMDLARFLALIDQKGLYFSRLHELVDTWEGAWSASDPLFRRDPEYMQLAASQLTSSVPLVSCWHENETESVAMWKLYVSGKEGVAIKTNVSSLIDLFSVGREMKLGRVLYRDINDFQHSPEVFVFEDGRCTSSTDVLPLERSVFRKNMGYRHEQEVRAVIYDTYCARQAIFSAGNLRTIELGLKEPEGPPGVNVPVDLALLIQEIVVSPAFPSWAIKSLQKAVDAAFFPAPPIEVKPSVLLSKPTIRKNP